MSGGKEIAKSLAKAVLSWEVNPNFSHPSRKFADSQEAVEAMRVEDLFAPLRPGIAIVIVLAALTAMPESFAQEKLTPLVSSRDRFTKATYFGSFSTPSINDKGSVAFYSTIYGRKVNRATNAVICLLKNREPVLIARENVTAIQLTGDPNPVPLFALGLTPQINGSNRVAWTGKFDVDEEEFVVVGLGNAKGKLRLFPGRSGGFITGENLDVNAKGRVATKGDLSVLNEEGDFEDFETLFRMSFLRAQAVMSAGETPIGMPLGTTFESFGLPTLDDRDSLYYVANISDTGSQFDGIWHGRTADPNPLVTIEDSAPGGADFVSFQDPPVASANGKLCAFAASTDSTENTGVWIADVQTGGLTEVATNGTRVSGVALTAFKAAAVNNNGTVAFMAMVGNRDGIVAGQSGNLRTIVRRATTVLVNGKSKRIIDLRFDPVGGLNNNNQIVFTASFNDRSSGIFVIQL